MVCIDNNVYFVDYHNKSKILSNEHTISMRMSQANHSFFQYKRKFDPKEEIQYKLVFECRK